MSIDEWFKDFGKNTTSNLQLVKYCKKLKIDVGPRAQWGPQEKIHLLLKCSIPDPPPKYCFHLRVTVWSVSRLVSALYYSRVFCAQALHDHRVVLEVQNQTIPDNTMIVQQEWPHSGHKLRQISNKGPIRKHIYYAIQD